MSVISKKTINKVGGAIKDLENYYKDLRAFFEFVEIRFRLDEYGVKLKSISENRFFSNDSGFKLSDDSDYPFYLWIPSWLGRFYCEPDLSDTDQALSDYKLDSAKVISFIWLWHGSGDAYVNDQNRPECWVGVAAPKTNDKEETLGQVADTIFKQFRVERTSIKEQDDGWIKGQFRPNSIGCNLTGNWYLKRIPMDELLTFYQIEQSVVKSIGEKHHELLIAEKEIPSINGVYKH